MTFKVYDNGCDQVVAESIDDAWKVWCETTGEDRPDYEDMEWAVEQSDMLQTIRFEDEDYADYNEDGYLAFFDEHYEEFLEWAVEDKTITEGEQEYFLENEAVHQKIKFTLKIMTIKKISKIVYSCLPLTLLIFA